MQPSDLDALIAKLEGATEGSRDLDRLIVNAVYQQSGEQEAWKFVYSDTQEPVPLTTSLDAALTLVPDDAFWRVGHDGEGPDPGSFRADVLHPIPVDRRTISGKGIASTAPLALTIAALKSRALSADREASHG